MTATERLPDVYLMRYTRFAESQPGKVFYFNLVIDARPLYIELQCIVVNIEKIPNASNNNYGNETIVYNYACKCMVNVGGAVLQNRNQYVLSILRLPIFFPALTHTHTLIVPPRLMPGRAAVYSAATAIVAINEWKILRRTGARAPLRSI